MTTFELEGPLGIAQCFEDKCGYFLYFEDTTGLYPTRPIKLRDYANRVNALHDAFEDAKQAVGLDSWNVTWETFKDDNGG